MLTKLNDRMEMGNGLSLNEIRQRIESKHDNLYNIRMKGYEIAKNPNKLHSLIGHNSTKTNKGEKYNVKTGIVYMIPSNQSGVELCGKRSKECSQLCLVSSGRGAYQNVKVGRMRKTYQFLNDPYAFVDQLALEIPMYFKRFIVKGDFNLYAVRLNGTSDIDYTRIPVRYNGDTYDNIFNVFEDNRQIVFYDYTKRLNIAMRSLDIPNYHITFSYSGTKVNAAQCKTAINLGLNIAVPFRNDLPLPTEYNGLKVYDGDISDARFLESTYTDPVVIGLSAKGKAMGNKDNGFIVDQSKL